MGRLADTLEFLYQFSEGKGQNFKSRRVDNKDCKIVYIDFYSSDFKKNRDEIDRMKESAVETEFEEI